MISHTATNSPCRDASAACRGAILPQPITANLGVELISFKYTYTSRGFKGNQVNIKGLPRADLLKS
jgi:hypothetical protein